MIRPIICLFITAALLSGCRNNSRTAQSTEGKETSYAIVYNVLVDEASDNYDVFVMGIDGSGKRNISRTPGVEWSYISVNDRILFISDKDTCRRCYFLYQTNHPGEDPVRISDIRLADSWMSSRNNGEELIVKPHPSIDTAFYILDDRGHVIQKVVPPLPYFGDPLFVDGGRKIVFRGGSTRSKLIEGFREELYIMDVSDDSLGQLSHYPEDDTTAGRFAYRAGPPKQHPTEHFISYQSKRDGKYSLYAVSLEGKELGRITENPQNEGWHDWSPDGKWLAIELFDDDQTQFHIGLMNWETGEMNILTDTAFRYQQCPNFLVIP